MLPDAEAAPPRYSSDEFVNDPGLTNVLRRPEDDCQSVDFDEDQHCLKHKKPTVSTSDLSYYHDSCEALSYDFCPLLDSAAPALSGASFALPVCFHIGSGSGLSRTAIAWVGRLFLCTAASTLPMMILTDAKRQKPNLAAPNLQDIMYRWTYGQAFTRTRTLWSGDGTQVWDVVRLSVSRHGHWVVSLPDNGREVITIERKAIFPLRLQVRIKNELLKSDEGVDRSTHRSTQVNKGSWTMWTAKRTPFLGWKVLTDSGSRVIVEYSQALAHDFDVTGTSAPSTPSCVRDDLRLTNLSVPSYMSGGRRNPGHDLSRDRERCAKRDLCGGHGESGSQGGCYGHGPRPGDVWPQRRYPTLIQAFMEVAISFE